VLRRQTQTEHYWVEDFEITQADLDYLYNVLLERETPLSADEMALVLVRFRVQSEEDALARRVGQGQMYQPENHYRIGQRLIFPQLDFAVGEVVGERPGYNPENGDFTVIQVDFGEGKTREFAGDLSGEHPLNFLQMPGDEPDLVSAEELFIEYGGAVAETLERHLKGHDDIVRLAGRWFPRSLLANVNIGHLNLAEAALDVHGGGPMTTRQILEEVGMLEHVNERLAEFSMNYALQEDPRFDEVGPAGQVVWYLTRLEPPEVQSVLERLRYQPEDYDRNLLTPELLELEAEIEDELSPGEAHKRPTEDSLTITLTFPHQRVGTLPLSARLRPFFPTAYETPRIRFVLIDGQTGQEMPGWVVREHGYVFGLAEWYRAHDIPVGGYVQVSLTDDPGKVRVDYSARRPQTEWLRVAVADGSHLRFEMQRRSIGCEYDDLMVVGIGDAKAVDAIWQHTAEQHKSLEQIMTELFVELAKLNPQSTVHAKTLYSAVNVVRRCPPGPIFARLVALPAFEHVGGPYWRLAST
jgi:hypothetical protein